MALRPFPNAGFACSKPDHFKIINEGQPSYMMEAHPALAKSKLRPPSKEEIGDLYRMFFDKEPPKDLAEWKARYLKEGQEIPDYAQDMLKEMEDRQDEPPDAD